MLKIIIDQAKCIGCGTCVFLSPDNFELDAATGKAKVKKQPKALDEKINQAMTSCPVQAIFQKEE